MVRICSFNVENLFSRAKLLNFEENSEAAGLLAQVEELRGELRKTTYDGARILELYRELSEYIEIVEVRGKLFSRDKKQLKARGVEDWGGFIDFRREKFSEAARANTARVLREVNADICCLIEVESRPVLRHFCIDQLPKRGRFVPYRSQMLVDGNDPRGIDVAVASRHPPGIMRSHVDDRDPKGRTIFSRDCLEIEVALPGGQPLHLLLNHFKSKGYGTAATSDGKRKKQAQRVVEILAGYDLKKDFVVVAGDLNDTPGSKALAPLLETPDLFDVLAEKFSDPAERWTYHFRRNEQIDFVLVSAPLRERLRDAGVERRGIFEAGQYSGGTIQPFDTVKRRKDSASDHGAVWADFDV